MPITTIEEANDFRMRVLRHEELTDDEQREAVNWLRQNRFSAKPKEKKAKKEKPQQVTLEELDV